MLRVRTSTGVVGIGVLIAGCGGSPSTAKGPPPAPAPLVVSDPAHVEGEGDPAKTAAGPLFEAAGSCARTKPGVGARRAGPVRASAAVALASVGEGTGRRTLAYVADGDDAALHTVDVGQGKVVATTTLRGAPEQVLVLADGRVAVTLRQAAEVQVLEPTASPDAPLASLCSVSVPTEPIALAETPDGASLVLTSGWAHALTGFDAATLAARFQVNLPREPRSVVVSDDGKRAFVAHVVNARMSAVDLATETHEVRDLDLKMKQAMPGVGAGKTRSGCQGFALTAAVDLPRDGAAPPAPVGEKPPIPGTKPSPSVTPPPGPRTGPRTKPVGRLFAPFVTVDPGEATRATSGYGDAHAALPAEVSSVSVIDADAERPLTRAVAGLPAGFRPTADQSDCLLPRSAAYFDGSLFVTCQGNDTLVEYDARGVDPARTERRRWRMPSGPTGVAIDAPGDRAVVYAQFEHKLTIVPLAAGQQLRAVPLPRPAKPALSAEQERGRVLFHVAHDPRISADGRACASCHPDGREDALTWSTPEGPRQTLMLVGRLADSAPYGWNGTSATVADHLHHTFERLEGRGLPDDDLRALNAYVSALAPPQDGRPTVHAVARKALLERGRALFASSEASCASCHPGGRTDGQLHAVARRSPGDRSDKLETPSLRYLGQSAPYFHDGRYGTLLQMLEATDHHMGHALQLDRDDRVALAAYLESL